MRKLKLYDCIVADDAMKLLVDAGIKVSTVSGTPNAL